MSTMGKNKVGGGLESVEQGLAEKKALGKT